MDNELSDAIRSIAHGGVDGPGGIEGLTMAISGHPVKDPSLAESNLAIASAIDRLAEAVERIADKLGD
jgi:hypothetical protein